MPTSGPSASSGPTRTANTRTRTPFGLLLIGEIVERLRLRPPETEFEGGLRHFGRMLIQITMILVFALAVGLTPELLPAIVSITLARGA